MINPNFALAHYNLGLALCAKKDYEGASLAFTQAVEQFPKTDPLHQPAQKQLQQCEKELK